MRIVFMGTGEIGLPTLEMLATHPAVTLVGVVCQPDRPAGRKKQLRMPDTKACALQKNIPIFQPEKIRSPESVTHIASWTPDLIVVIAYGQILPASILKLPRIGCLNLHASLLPRFRGAAPIQAAILEGDTETGMTVMWMDEGLDTGDIFLQQRISIQKDETGGSLHDRLAILAAKAMEEALEKLLTGEKPRQVQPAEGVTYVGLLDRAKAQIDWNDSALHIERKIRAYNPWPVAWSLLREQEKGSQSIQIHSAQVERSLSLPPGKTIILSDGSLGVGTGDHLLRILSLTLTGKRRMDSKDFVRGHPQVQTAFFE